jgi:hypothetical protein
MPADCGMPLYNVKLILDVRTMWYILQRKYLWPLHRNFYVSSGSAGLSPAPKAARDLHFQAEDMAQYVLRKYLWGR